MQSANTEMLQQQIKKRRDEIKTVERYIDKYDRGYSTR